MKTGILVSDFQVGAITGILPPSFETSEGIVVPQNAAQTYLWNCWDDYTNWAGAFNPDFVIVNGDVNEGTQRKGGGRGLSLRMLVDQKRASVAVLQHLKSRLSPTCKWFFTQGTEYHVGEAGDVEEDIAVVMGAEKYFSLGTGVLVREVLWLDVDGVILEAYHHISPTSGFYRLTILDREMQWSAITGKDASRGIPKADLIIRSHVHNFQAAEHASKQGVVLPCWQIQTEYMRRKPNSVHRMHPDIGGVVIKVDGEAKKRGEAPVEIIKRLYGLPAVPVTKL